MSNVEFKSEARNEEQLVIRYRNVTDLVNRANPLYSNSEDDIKQATRVWKKIRNLFAVYATSRQLPKGVEKWYVIGKYNTAVVVASSEHLAPNKPPRYIAYVSRNEVLVIDSSITAYRRVYVKILRLLAKATIVKTA